MKLMTFSIKHNASKDNRPISNGVKNFWDKLPKPFFVQAPMEDVTDAAFRRLIAKYADPELPRVMFTEFTSADGLIFAEEDGQRRLRRKLLYSESERPIVAQLFSAVPQRMEKAAKIVAELGFDGLDINMGCPDRAVEKQGCGASLMKDPCQSAGINLRRANIGTSCLGKNEDWIQRKRARYMAAGITCRKSCSCHHSCAHAQRNVGCARALGCCREGGFHSK
jgi:hypothetical protein